jgi:hypothetical protein
MNDPVYQKQLEEFGIVATRVPPAESVKKQDNTERTDNNTVMKNLLSTMQGRQWLYRKLDLCGTFMSPFVPGKPDSTAFFSGLQSFGHVILGEIMESDPDKFWLMIQEDQARRSANQQK